MSIKIPVIPSASVFRRVFKIKRSLLSEIERFHSIYGDVFAIKADNLKCFIRRPDLIKQVLVDQHLNYEKGVGFKFFHPLIGKGLLTSDGEKWMKERKVLNFEFTGLSEETNLRIVEEELQKLTLHWGDGTEVNFTKEIHKLTVRTICRILFNYEVEDNIDQVRSWFQDYDAFIGRQQKSLIKMPMWLPLPYILRAKKAKRALRGFAQEILRSELTSQTRNMVQRMKEAQFDDENICDHILTFFIAGHETSANSMNFTMLLLRDNPQYIGRLVAQDQDWTDLVIKESLRLFPTIPLFPRVAKADGQLGEFQVSKGDLIAFSPWIMHRSSVFWEAPLSFLPERFIGKRPEKDFIYFPFGLGPRKCIGASLSNLQMKAIFNFIFGRFEFSIHGPSLEKITHNISLSPSGDVVLKEVRRRP